eukprot:TRINITY_DN55470_c0_g1_i3.p2 TRINITY_DN55470_c0_g1~~TRINITY_DN55470_c0_g1_i3.p2  ORF type:complete len:116 (-),score=17.61 TRINITY_DN55470_c0_g1_i3:39-386(-)
MCILDAAPCIPAPEFGAGRFLESNPSFSGNHLVHPAAGPSRKMLASHLAFRVIRHKSSYLCLLYTSDAADEEDSVDLGGRRIIKKKKRLKKKDNKYNKIKKIIENVEDTGRGVCR